MPFPQPILVESVFAARTYPSSSGPGPLQVQVQGPAACVLQRLLMPWLHAAPEGKRNQLSLLEVFSPPRFCPAASVALGESGIYVGVLWAVLRAAAGLSSSASLILLTRDI